jgi:hypothetical protein
MIIPKKIMIGETEYKVKKKTLLFPTNLGGQINYFHQKLTIRKGGSERNEEDIFFHEIAHGILKEIEYNHPSITKFRNDEQFVQEMGLIMRKTFKSLISQQQK